MPKASTTRSSGRTHDMCRRAEAGTTSSATTDVGATPLVNIALPMPDSHLNVFKKWRTADRQAHDLEHALIKASLAALDGYGDPPDHNERERAQKLRHTADNLFHLAMAEMKEWSEANRR